MKVHVYSDLALRYFEFADPVDETCPSVDLIAVPGNISNDTKRSLLFQENLTAHGLPVLLNLGKKEITGGEMLGDILAALDLRYAVKREINCVFKSTSHVDLSDPKVSVLQLFGFPKFESDQALRESSWYGFYPLVRYGRFYNDQGVLIGHVDHSPITAAEINQLHQQEQEKLVNWFASTSGLKKILLWGNSDVSDLIKYRLDDVTVIAVGDEFRDQPLNQGRLYSNPGRGAQARSNILEI